MSRSGRKRPRWTLARYDAALAAIGAALSGEEGDCADTSHEDLQGAHAVLCHDRELLVRRKARRERDLTRAGLPALPAVGDMVEVRLAGQPGWHRGTVTESSEHGDKIRVDVESTGRSHHYGRGSLDWIRSCLVDDEHKGVRS